MRLVVTGTDTGIGKTVLAGAIALATGSAYWKPIQAGLDDQTDSERVAALGVRTLPEAYRLSAPCSPHWAAEIDGVEIDDGELALPEGEDRLVVEGAGGVLVPLDARRDMLDIALVLSLPVLLVVAVRLGCLNHALLSAHAIHCRGLAFAGWVANLVEPKMARADANIAALEERLPAPRVATIAWAKADAPQWGPGAGALGLG
jgi:dethiobiotin synthetase